jgi:hypothetical protein
MANITKEFVFEDSPQTLADGTQVLLLRDAIQRWEVCWPAGGQVYYFNFLILYEFPLSRFLLVQYGPCWPESTAKRWFKVQEAIWTSDALPQGEFIEAAEAYDAFRRYWPDQPLPVSLQVYAKSVPPPEPPTDDAAPLRPLEHWSRSKKLRADLMIPAQAAATLSWASALILSLWRFNQLARMWSADEPFPNGVLLQTLSDSLYGRYPNSSGEDPNGAKANKWLDVRELPWPEHLEDAGKCVEVIAELLEPPLRCLQFRFLPVGSVHRPSRTELAVAYHELKSRSIALDECLEHLEHHLNRADRFEELQLREEEWLAEHPDDAQSGKKSGQERCRPADLRALESWRYALDNMNTTDAPPARTVYAWLKEHGYQHIYGKLPFPKFLSWQRYMNRAKDIIRKTGYDPLTGEHFTPGER